MDDDERRRRAAAQEAEALHALEAIMNGGDLTAESARLSNEFTDRHTGRISGWFRRLRAPRPDERSAQDPAPDGHVD